MNDFKTCGCESSDTSHSPYVWNMDSGGGLCVSDAILQPYNVVLDNDYDEEGHNYGIIWGTVEMPPYTWCE